MVIVSERGLEMAGYLPPLYEQSTVMEALLEAEGTEMDLLRAAIEELRDQYFARTATWGLDRWDSFLGLNNVAGLSDLERQDRAIARIRGFGVANKELIEMVAEAFNFGAVEVTDQNDGVAPYAINVELVAPGGQPSNIDDFYQAIRAVVPAHLDITYTFNYLTWAEVDTQGWTWAQIDGDNPGGPAGAPVTWAEWDVIL